MDDTSPPSSEGEAAAKKSGFELKWPRQPYPGLRPFAVTDEVDESLVFFGRDKQKDEILRRLNDSHVVFVVGPSGSGKSSLVKAGVIPALKAGLLTSAGHRWRVAQTRPERRPLAQLAEALAELLAGSEQKGSISDCREEIEGLLREEDSALWLIADSISERHAADGHTRMRTLLLIDQFEEAFGPEIHDPEEVEQFFRILTRFFAKPHNDLYLIIAMRTGYVGSTAAHPDVAEMLNSTAYLTPILTPAQMARVISRPTETYGGSVEPKLLDAILADAGKPREDMADQLPLVQHALFWLWERAWRSAGFDVPPRPGDDPPAVVPPLSLAQFRKNDGLKGIMQRHAEDLYNAAVKNDDAAKRLFELVFKRLCERDVERRYRRTPPTMNELRELTGASEDEVRALIAPFIAPSAALLSVRPQAGSMEDVIDINHESLIRQWDRLRRWADEEAREVQIFRELVGNARQWEQKNKDEKYLQTGGQLELIEAFWTRVNPDEAWAKRYRTLNRKRSLAEDLPSAQAYVAASRELENNILKSQERQRERELRLTQWAAIGLVLLTLSAAISGLLYTSWDQQRTRISNTVATVGTLIGNDKPIDALLLAEAAVEEDLHLSDELQSFLATTVREFRLATEFRGSDFTTLAFSPTGNDLLIGDRQGRLHIWRDGDATPYRVTIQPEPTRDQKWFHWGPDGEFVYLSNAYRSGAAGVYKVGSIVEDGSESTLLQLHFPVGFDTRRAHISKDGDLFRLVTFGRDKIRLREWQGASGTPDRAVEVAEGTWGTDAVFSRDGRQLAVETDGEVTVYDVSKLGDLETVPTPPALNTGDRRSKLAFHPGEPDVVVTGTESGVIKLRSLEGGADLREMDQVDQIRTMTVSPDGSWIAASGEDGVIWLFPGSVDGDPTALDAVRLSGVTEIEELSFSSDSTRLASVSKDGVVRIWSVRPVSQQPPEEIDDWSSALKALRPTLIDTSGEQNAEPLELGPTLTCLVSPQDPDCAADGQ